MTTLIPGVLLHSPWARSRFVPTPSRSRSRRIVPWLPPRAGCCSCGAATTGGSTGRRAIESVAPAIAAGIGFIGVPPPRTTRRRRPSGGRRRSSLTSVIQLQISDSTDVKPAGRGLRAAAFGHAVERDRLWTPLQVDAPLQRRFEERRASQAVVVLGTSHHGEEAFRTVPSAAVGTIAAARRRCE
jgi:hypothetical protein